MASTQQGTGGAEPLLRPSRSEAAAVATRPTTHDFGGVTAVLQAYFDGLYVGDTALLREVFHADATYVCATGGEYVHLTMDRYFPVVDARPSPASRSEPRRDAIRSIEFAGPDVAWARVNCAIGPKFFTDFLSLIRVDGRWRIVAKVFHYDLEDDRD